MNTSGGFDFVVKLSDVMNLGPAHMQLDAAAPQCGVGPALRAPDPGAGVPHGPSPKSRRTPAKDLISSAKARTWKSTAAYYAGGPLPNAPVTWNVTATPGSYSPPGWDDFTFGRWVPWWRLWGRSRTSPDQLGQTFTGTTDVAGLHVVRIDFESVVPAEPSTVHVRGARAGM